MSIPRDPIFHTEEPSHNLIPAAGGAVWYALHDDSLAASITDLPTPLTELGTPAGGKWGTAGVYTFPTANTDCALQVEEHITNLYLHSNLSLYPAAVDAQIIVAMDAAYSVAPDGSSTLFCWGKYGTSSTIALDLTSSEDPRMILRGKGASAGTAVQQTLTADTGTFTQFKNQGVFQLVLGLRMATSTTIDVELRLGNSSLSALYSASGLDAIGDGSAVPGISGGITMADFGGLYLGCRGAGSPSNFWGRGTSNVAKLGNFSARRFEDYSASRVTDALTYMINRKRDFPRSLCSDYT